MGDDEETGVGWAEARRLEELAYAWDVVVLCGYVPVRTLLGTSQTRAVPLVQPCGFRGSPARLEFGVVQE